MAKILVVTSGLAGIYNSSQELMNRLKGMGHEVCSASPNQELDVSFSKFPHFKLNPLVQTPLIKIDFDEKLRGLKGLIYKYLYFKTRKNEGLKLLEPCDFTPLLDEICPDLIILDVEMHEYIIQAFSCNFKIILLSQWFSIWTNLELPDIQSEYTLARSNTKNLRWSTKKHFKLKYKRLYRSIKNSLLSAGLMRKDILLALAKKSSFPSRYIGSDFWPGPYLYEKIPVISMTLEELDFPHKKRENLFYTGPMVDLSRDEQIYTLEKYSKLRGALDWGVENQRKVIYCSLSTMQKGDIQFIQKVIQAVKGLDNCMMIVSIGNKINGEAFSILPENVFIFNNVPQVYVLSKADLSINHGGIHTINECLMLNVPMLIYSGKHADQNGCATRLAYHDLALLGDKDQDTSSDIRAKIILLEQSTFIKDKMESLKNRIKDKNANDQLEGLVVKVLNEDWSY